MTNEINNELVDDEPSVPQHECYFTGDRYNEDEMLHVPEDTNSQYAVMRRERWIDSHPGESIDNCPWTPRFVWIWEAVNHGYCNDCGALIDLEDDEYNGTLGTCGDCSNNYSYCYDHDSYYSESDCCSYCEDDEEDYDEYGSRLIHDYSYRPYPTFFVIKNGIDLGDINEPAQLSVTGFELEMEAMNCSIKDGSELANSLFGNVAYLKHDGSLNNGFEMVTHPMSLEYINTKFNFAGVKELADLGMRSAKTTTCGLHIHVNKGFFNNRATSMYRFMAMFYGNSEMWQRLAGRSRSSYAQWDLSEQERMLNYIKMLKNRNMGYGAYNEDRYVAVNLQPGKTVELRFFKGTLRPETLKARIQAIHAVAEYSVITRNNINIKQSSRWDEFRTWTESNADKFGAFNTYANEKGV